MSTATNEGDFSKALGFENGSGFILNYSLYANEIGLGMSSSGFSPSLFKRALVRSYETFGGTKKV